MKTHIGFQFSSTAKHYLYKKGGLCPFPHSGTEARESIVQETTSRRKKRQDSRGRLSQEGALNRKFHHLPPGPLQPAFISYFLRLGCRCGAWLSYIRRHPRSSPAVACSYSVKLLHPRMPVSNGSMWACYGSVICSYSPVMYFFFHGFFLPHW